MSLRKQPGQRRRDAVQCMVTEAEKQRVFDAAEREGLSVSDFVRRILLRETSDIEQREGATA